MTSLNKVCANLGQSEQIFAILADLLRFAQCCYLSACATLSRVCSFFFYDDVHGDVVLPLRLRSAGTIYLFFIYYFVDVLPDV